MKKDNKEDLDVEKTDNLFDSILDTISSFEIKEPEIIIAALLKILTLEIAISSPDKSTAAKKVLAFGLKIVEMIGDLEEGLFK